MKIEENPDARFLEDLSAHSRRLLEDEELVTIQLIASCTASELLQLGVKTEEIPILERAMAAEGFSFRA